MTKKGVKFEYSVMNFFQQNGYFSRQGIPFKNDVNGKIDATDIDVYGIQFMGLFEPYIISCDCKNKARAKPFERIFWAKGLGETAKVDKVYVALNRVSDEIIEFAKKSNITVLSNDVLSTFTKEHRMYGLADFDFYSDFEPKFLETIKSFKSLEELFMKSNKVYMNRNPYVNVNVCMDSLYHLSKWYKFEEKQSENEKETLKFLISMFSVLLGLQILWICSDTIGFSATYRKKYILNKLAYGNNDPKYIDKIFRDVTILANEIVKTNVPNGAVPDKVSLGNIEPPNYGESLSGLIERAFLNPQNYIKLPQYLDFYFFECLMKKKKFSPEEIEQTLNDSEVDLKMKSVRNVIHFIKSYTGLDINKIFELEEMKVET